MVRKVLRYRYRQLRMFSTLVRQVRLPCIKTFMKNNPTLSNALIYGGLYTAAEISQQSIRNHRAAAVSGLGSSQSDTEPLLCRAFLENALEKEDRSHPDLGLPPPPSFPPWSVGW